MRDSGFNFREPYIKKEKHVLSLSLQQKLETQALRNNNLKKSHKNRISPSSLIRQRKGTIFNRTCHSVNRGFFKAFKNRIALFFLVSQCCTVYGHKKSDQK